MCDLQHKKEKIILTKPQHYNFHTYVKIITLRVVVHPHNTFDSPISRWYFEMGRLL
jgi:hypothetical protein